MQADAVMAGPAVQALAYLDQALAAAPKPAPALFSACVRQLAELRDTMAAHQRQAAPDPAARTRLSHVNGVISVVMAGQFPLGPVPWAELRKARDWLAALV